MPHRGGGGCVLPDEPQLVERLRAARLRAARLFLASALLTSRLVPRGLSLLGIVGYAALLLGIADLAPPPAPGSCSWCPEACSSSRSRSC